MYKKIGLALAFSPRCGALLLEAIRIQSIFNAELILIHVGEKNSQNESFLNEALTNAGIDKQNTKVIWEQGNTTNTILSICEREKVELLVAGALEKENLFRYYIGSVARTILRKANCSVLVITKPSLNPKPFKKIVVQAGASDEIPILALKTGCDIAKIEQTSLHIIREIQMYGLSMAIASEKPEIEYSETKKQIVNKEIRGVTKALKDLETDGLKINIKITAGKPGHELYKFIEKIDAELLVMQGMNRELSLFDRIFRQDLEYIMTNLPSNLLIVH